MNQCVLTLIPYNKTPLVVNLSVDEKSSTVDEILESSVSVFSDLSYSAQIDGIDISSVSKLLFYINGYIEECQFTDGKIRFPANDNRGERRVFIDCYGFIEISIVLKFDNQEEMRLHSDYISVLVRKGNHNDSVKAMAAYVYNNQQELLF